MFHSSANAAARQALRPTFIQAALVFEDLIAVDARTQKISAAVISDEYTAKSRVLPKLIEKSSKSVRRVLDDGAYDRKMVREFLSEDHIDPCISPRRGVMLRKGLYMKARNQDILAI